MTDSTAAPSTPGWAASRMSERLPVFPWDTVADLAATASAHPAGVIDLSVGTPVDPVPEVAQQALAAAADSPGYPATAGSASLRFAAAEWLQRRTGAVGMDPDRHVLPSIGSKELVAWLPTLLGLGADDLVMVPELAYPTYEIGVRLAGAVPLRADATSALGPQRPALIWINTPANPSGRVLGVEHLRKMVAFARQRGALLVSDECYLELGWDVRPVSVLHRDVCDGDVTGLLAVHSLSKRSNLAGYRAGLVAGDPGVISELLAVRKHAGMMTPAPVQAAAAAAWGDDEHVNVQRSRYRRRRDVLAAGLRAAGFRIDDSEAGLYLWVTRGEPARQTAAWLADRGLLVAPGDFYGPAGRDHVRVALTVSDAGAEDAAERLAAG